MANGKAKRTGTKKAAHGSVNEAVRELTAEAVQKSGIKTGEQAYSILRGILERQDGNNAPGCPGDGEELYLFCEAFKALDAHMRNATGSGPTEWRNR